jgi:hypothetical protein
MKKLCVSLASLLVSALAPANTVDNPGPFNLIFDAGTLKIGRLNPVSIDQLMIAGSVDGDGNVNIPAEGIVLPDYVVTTDIGDVTVRFVPLADATGTLIPLTGEATATVTMRIRLIHPLLPDTCGIGSPAMPINPTLTTGSDGAFMGVPYSTDTGDATYVNGTFSVPASDGCGFFGGLVDGQVGLPSPSGNNYVDGLHGTFDTIFFGS